MATLAIARKVAVLRKLYYEMKHSIHDNNVPPAWRSVVQEIVLYTYRLQPTDVLVFFLYFESYVSM
jgi:hypothetical protein